MTPADHFSSQATGYARYRPGYPAALFAGLGDLCPRHELAWDCGTGNGQAAAGLARHFRRVIATDPSGGQLGNAKAAANIDYRLAAEADVHIAGGSVDLVCAAQAAHWFDLDRFYSEVRRVATLPGIVALWTYRLPRVVPAVDALIDEFHGPVVGVYWPTERRHVDSGYRDLPFPFEEIMLPAMDHAVQWTAGHLLEYLGTWSAVKYFRQATGTDPVARLRDPLLAAWGGERERTVHWPLAIRIGRVHAPRGSTAAGLVRR